MTIKIVLKKIPLSSSLTTAVAIQVISITAGNATMTTNPPHMKAAQNEEAGALVAVVVQLAQVIVAANAMVLIISESAGVLETRWNSAVPEEIIIMTKTMIFEAKDLQNIIWKLILDQEGVKGGRVAS